MDPPQPPPNPNRHWGKFLCAGITLAILGTIAIVTPLLWYART